jgi:hypothetical protein
MRTVSQKVDGWLIVEKMLEAYSHSVTFTNLRKSHRPSNGAKKRQTSLKSNKTSQPIKKFSFITNLITSTKTIEDMSNQDQILNSGTKST